MWVALGTFFYFFTQLYLIMGIVTNEHSVDPSLARVLPLLDAGKITWKNYGHLIGSTVENCIQYGEGHPLPYLPSRWASKSILTRVSQLPRRPCRGSFFAYTLLSTLAHNFFPSPTRALFAFAKT